MKTWIVLPLAALVAALTSLALVLFLDTGPVRAEAAPGVELDELASALRAIEARQEALANSLESLRASVELAPPSAPARVSVGEIDAAVARWMDAHGEDEPRARVADAARSSDAPGEAVDLAGLDAAAILDLLMDEDLPEIERQELWRRLSEAGRLDEVVAEYERLAELEPGNPELQVSLGEAYLQKIFEVGNGPLAGVWANKADSAFDRALEIDPSHWDARFYKAVSLSNWPAFLGKSGEAIRQFEVLIDQQSQRPSRPEYAETYLYLGNMYEQTGKAAKALETWQRGLALYPGNENLRRQVELAGQ